MKVNNKKIIINLILILVFILPFNFYYIFNFSTIKEVLFFKETLQYSIYAFDIVFLFILFFWLKEKIKNNSIEKFIKNNWFLWLLVFYFLFNSFFVSLNPFSSLYNSLRILEVLVFFLILVNTIKSKQFLEKIFSVIFISGIIQSIIAFFQFIFQKSLGLKYLGETVLSPQILGIAKIEDNGEKFIRAYGTFPHPNLLGIFLFLSLFCGIYLFLHNKKFKTPALKFFLPLCFFIILIGILLTFSRSIWLITFLLGLTIILRYSKNLFKPDFRIKNSVIYIFIIFSFTVIILLVFSKVISIRICYQNCQDQSLIFREIYLNFSQKIIQNNFLTGIGIGQFTSFFKEINPYNLPEWNLQPVHNFYLLITSELGIIGLLLLIFFIISKISFSFFKKSLLEFLFVAFLFVAFFDHYFWTLPQGQFIFWLTLALLTSSSRIKEVIKK
jgi:O-antigen ligase